MPARGYDNVIWTYVLERLRGQPMSTHADQLPTTAEAGATRADPPDRTRPCPGTRTNAPRRSRENIAISGSNALNDPPRPCFVTIHRTKAVPRQLDPRKGARARCWCTWPRSAASPIARSRRPPS